MSVLLVSFSLKVTLQGDPPPGQWELAFEENFDGQGLDGSTWKIGLADAGIEGVGGNTPDAISVEYGVLVFTAGKEPSVFCSKDFPFSTAEISTFLRYNQRYGYFEARMRWDTGVGMWPAFWLMPQRDVHGVEEYYNNTFLKFDLSGLEAENIESAKLRLKVINIGNSEKQPNNLQLFRVEDDAWTESEITWDTQPRWDPLFLAQKFGYNAEPGDTIEIDVTEYIQAQQKNDAVASFALADEFRRARGQFFHSKEAGNPDDWPSLVVNDVVLHPTDDAYVVWGKNSGKNFGASNDLRVRTHYHNSTDDTHHGGMEIDIMETLGVWGPNVTSHAVHWDGYGSGHKAAGWGPVPTGKTDEFRLYGLYWGEGVIEFYVDGVKTGEYRSERVMNVPAYIILSLQLGGWDGNRPTEAIDGLRLEVDYVKTWTGTRQKQVSYQSKRLFDGRVVFGEDFTEYGGTGNAGSNITVADDGGYFTMSGNGWTKFPLEYEITPDTVLEFAVKSDNVGEILGIGFDEDDTADNGKRVFQLAGEQTWKDAWQEHNDYAGEAEMKRYRIEIGKYYTGLMTHLVFVADSDRTRKIYAMFGGVKVYEGTTNSKTIGIE